MSDTVRDSNIFEINELEENNYHLKKPDFDDMERMWSIGTDMMTIPFAKREKLARMLNFPEKSKEKLLDERRELVEKKFNGDGLSEREEKKLALIRWKLDRINEAEFGDHLDNLEIFVAAQERLSEDLHLFLKQYGK